MLSHNMSGPARKNPNSGVFLREQLREIRKLVTIFLYAPVDITPSFSNIIRQKGIGSKIKEIRDHYVRTVITKLPNLKDPVQGKCIRFVSIPPKKNLAILGAGHLFLRIMRQIKIQKKYFDFDLVHGQTVLPDGLTAVFLGKHFRRRSIITVRGSDVNAVKENSGEYKTVRYALKQADMITCVSKELKKRMINQFVIPEENIVVISNGINLEFSRRNLKKNVRKRYNIPQKAPLFLFVGSFFDVKDPLTMLCAFKKVQNKVINAHLLMVGSGYMENDVHTYVKTQSIQDHVHLPGYVSHQEVAEYMNECDIFCLSSLQEGWPNVLFEAMSFGKPIVATNVGGIPEAVCSEDYGFLVPPSQPDKMAAAMLEAVQKKWDHNKIRNYAHDNSWEKVAKKYLDVYEKVLSNQKADM